MSVELSIFQQGLHKKGALRFRASKRNPDNANSLSLLFESDEHAADPGDIWVVSNKVQLYNLSDTDAEILSSAGRLDAERRKALLPHLRTLLAGAEQGEATETEAFKAATADMLQKLSLIHI